MVHRSTIENTSARSGWTKKTIAGMAAAAVTSMPFITACAPNKVSAEPVPASGPATPGHEVSTAPSTQEAEQTIDLTDLSPENLWKMTPEQRLDAIRIPESALEDPEGYVKTYNKYLEAIYNAGSSDAEYEWFITDGPGATVGAGFRDYVFETYHIPMLLQLQGHAPSDNLEDGGAKTVAARLYEVQYLRLERKKEDVKPYHLTIKLGDISAPVGGDKPTLGFDYVMGDTIGPVEVAYFEEKWATSAVPVTLNIIDDTPAHTDLVGVYYDDELGSVVPTTMRSGIAKQD